MISRIPSGELSESLPVGGGSSGLLARAGATGTLLLMHGTVVRELETSRTQKLVLVQARVGLQEIHSDSQLLSWFLYSDVGYAASGPKSGEGCLGSEGQQASIAQGPERVDGCSSPALGIQS